MHYQFITDNANFKNRPGVPSDPISANLALLVDTIDATEEAGWTDLPPPIPLFCREVRRSLMESLGFVVGAE